jgi:tetratricopeptide (TPR) repeat protein
MANCKRIAFPFLFLAVVPLLSAQRGNPGASHAPQTHLGKVDFPTSCSANVQPLLEKGIALLHSFQYEEAQQTFADAKSRNPKCAIAHWGAAMALYHQLWDFPNDAKLQEGRAEIEQARKLHPATPKEKGFVTAAAAFFEKNPKLSHEKRTRAYSSAMEKFHRQMPGDAEVGSFYALTLVSLAEQDVDALNNQKKAIAILDPIFQKYPDHPGLAHYLIHAADRPELAQQGLAAARRYAAIAPDSPHALHMPSHIFVWLGYWQDSIASNIASVASARHLAEEHKAEAHYQTHAMDFLHYSYLQSGQEAKAREVVESADQVVGASHDRKVDHHAYLASRTAIELHRWTEAARLQEPAASADKLDTVRWAKAIGAARNGDVAGAESAVKALQESVAARKARAQKEGYPAPKEKATDLREAEAWLAFAKGQTDAALEELRAAVAHQERNGGESVTMPAREMLADMLLELNRPAEALVEYQTVLKTTPNRFDGLLGGAHAAQAAGNVHLAQTLYAQLAGVCPAGADRPELQEARATRRENTENRRWPVPDRQPGSSLSSSY